MPTSIVICILLFVVVVVVCCLLFVVCCCVCAFSLSITSSLIPAVVVVAVCIRYFGCTWRKRNTNKSWPSFSVLTIGKELPALAKNTN